jgi:hypothetical protein
MYRAIAEPFVSTVEVTARHLTTKLWLAGSTEIFVGAAETPRGITVVAITESGPGPAAFVAATLIVYLVPLVRPLIEQLVAVEGAVQVKPLGVAVAT